MQYLASNDESKHRKHSLNNECKTLFVEKNSSQLSVNVKKEINEEENRNLLL